MSSGLETITTLIEDVEDVEEGGLGLVAIAYTTATAAQQQDLGMINGSAQIIEVDVGKKSYTILQSPGLLHSDRAEGTTGAVAWRSGARVANMFASHAPCGFARRLLDGRTVWLELGCGISPLVALAVKDKVSKYWATDQNYVLGLFRENLERNDAREIATASGKKAGTILPMHHGTKFTIATSILDWETDDALAGQPWSFQIQAYQAQAMPAGTMATFGIDVLLACDCIYNMNIQPFVDTCRAICSLRTGSHVSLTQCLIVHQLRSSDVLNEWLRAMLKSFDVRFVHDEALPNELQSDSGFLVFIASLPRLRQDKSNSDTA